MALIPESLDAINWEELDPCSVEPINALIAAVRERMIRADYFNKEYSPSFFPEYCHAQTINILNPDEILAAAFYHSFISPETALTATPQKITDKWILERFPLAMQRIPPGILPAETCERLFQIYNAIQNIHYVSVNAPRAGHFIKVIQTVKNIPQPTLAEAWSAAVKYLENWADAQSDYEFVESDIAADNVPCFRSFSARYDSGYDEPYIVSMRVAGVISSHKYIITNLKNIPVKRSWRAEYSGDIKFNFGFPFDGNGMIFPDGIDIPAKGNLEHDGFWGALPSAPPADLTEALLKSKDGVDITGRVDIAAVDDLRPGLRYI